MVFRDKILILNSNSITYVTRCIINSLRERERELGAVVNTLYAVNRSLYNLISLLYIVINSFCIFVP